MVLDSGHENVFGLVKLGRSDRDRCMREGCTM